MDCPFSGKRLKSVVVEVSKSALSTRTRDRESDLSKRETNLSDETSRGNEHESKLIDALNSTDEVSVKSPKVKVQVGVNEGNT